VPKLRALRQQALAPWVPRLWERWQSEHSPLAPWRLGRWRSGGWRSGESLFDGRGLAAWMLMTFGYERWLSRS
jgi:hypothetical protein